MTDLQKIEKAVAALKLCVVGGFNEDGKALVLLGPDEPNGFWSEFKASNEYQDGQADPMDRWSRRVISRVANELHAEPLFPFGGEPYHPFFTWALKTGRVFESPVKLLVHDTSGLWVSFRGALRFDEELKFPDSAESPCETCKDKPCLDTCPVKALTGSGYDVPKCREYLALPEVSECNKSGCLVRSSCPVSQSWNRIDEQSKFHMSAFY